MAVLAAGVVFIMLNDQKKPKSTLPSTVLALDTVTLDRISIQTGGKNEPYELVREGSDWKLKLSNGKLVDIQQNTLISAIQKVATTKPKRVITRKEEKWSQYDVNDEKGIQVNFFSGSDVLGGVVIGRFDFNQQTRSMTNYVRLADKNDVYLIKDPLSFDWNKEPAGWRNGSIASINQNNLSKVIITGEMDITLTKGGTSWSSTDPNMDSLEIDRYLGSFSNITSKNYFDDVEIGSLGAPKTIVELHGNDGVVTLTTHVVGDKEVLRSSVNPTSVFVLDEPIRAKIFPDFSEEPGD